MDAFFTQPPNAPPPPSGATPDPHPGPDRPAPSLIEQLSDDPILAPDPLPSHPQVLVLPERRTNRLASIFLIPSIAISAALLISSKPWSRPNGTDQPRTALPPAGSTVLTDPRPLPPHPAVADPSASAADLVVILPTDPPSAPTEPNQTTQLLTPLVATTPPSPPHAPAPAPAGEEVSANTVDPTARAWAEIEDQAGRLAAERDQLDRLKPALLEQEVLERQRQDLNRRLAFLDQLRHAATHDPAALHRLAEHSDPPPALRSDASARLDELARSRSLRAAWISRLRGLGYSEPAILDEIARAWARNRTTRNGPQTRTEALRRAAAELIAVPLAASPNPKPPAASRSVRSGKPAAHGPNSTSPFGLSLRRRLTPQPPSAPFP
ncbi:MAG: hypothetical protein KatS3mg108_3218 [Isosphaeraceae bacterium]|nr:MAG: hypothetical protein KatS3mg108_3218 [Isosphaeraceae bacterium]